MPVADLTKPSAPSAPRIFDTRRLLPGPKQVILAPAKSYSKASKKSEDIELIARIDALRDQGYFNQQIRKELGVSNKFIKRHATRARTMHDLTPEERDKIIQLHIEGMFAKQISKTLGISTTKVRAQLKTWHFQIGKRDGFVIKNHREQEKVSLVDLVDALRDQGYFNQQIREELNVSNKFITEHATRARTVTLLTAEDRDNIIELHVEGFFVPEIAKKLRLSADKVRAQLKTWYSQIADRDGIEPKKRQHDVKNAALSL